MTKYEQGFMSKCAEYGINGVTLLKFADALNLAGSAIMPKKTQPNTKPIEHVVDKNRFPKGLGEGAILSPDGHWVDYPLPGMPHENEVINPDDPLESRAITQRRVVADADAISARQKGGWWTDVEDREEPFFYDTVSGPGLASRGIRTVYLAGSENKPIGRVRLPRVKTVPHGQKQHMAPFPISPGAIEHARQAANAGYSSAPSTYAVYGGPSHLKTFSGDESTLPDFVQDGPNGHILFNRGPVIPRSAANHEGGHMRSAEMKSRDDYSEWFRNNPMGEELLANAYGNVFSSPLVDAALASHAVGTARLKEWSDKYGNDPQKYVDELVANGMDEKEAIKETNALALSAAINNRPEVVDDYNRFIEYFSKLHPEIASAESKAEALSDMASILGNKSKMRAAAVPYGMAQTGTDADWGYENLDEAAARLNQNLNGYVTPIDVTKIGYDSVQRRPGTPDEFIRLAEEWGVPNNEYYYQLQQAAKNPEFLKLYNALNGSIAAPNMGLLGAMSGRASYANPPTGTEWPISLWRDMDTYYRLKNEQTKRQVK